MSTFIKVIEIWTLNTDKQGLGLADTFYSDSDGVENKYLEYNEFREVSEQHIFGYDEGLPGKAWAAVSPLIITDLEHSYFQRKGVAAKAGLTVGLAIPIFSGEFLIAVIVFLCGEGQGLAGAIELWEKLGNKSEQKIDALGLVDGYYGSLRKLESVSRGLQFAKGNGLPGSVWDYHIPMVVANMSESSLFKRASTAAVEGVSTAIGLPLFYYTGKEYVVTFLSARSTPIALQYQVWLPDRDHNYLFLHACECEAENNLVSFDKNKHIKRNDGMIGNVWSTGTPIISNNPAADGLLQKGSKSDYKTGFVMPLIEEGFLKSVVVLVF